MRSRGQLKCDGTRAETRFRLSAKRTSPIKSAGASVQSTTGSRTVRISGSNAGYTMFQGSVKSTGYPLHSPFSSSLPHPCVSVFHHISTGVYTHCVAKCRDFERHCRWYCAFDCGYHKSVQNTVAQGKDPLLGFQDENYTKGFFFAIHSHQIYLQLSSNRLSYMFRLETAIIREIYIHRKSGCRNVRQKKWPFNNPD